MKDYVLPRWVNLISEEGEQFWNDMVKALEEKEDIDLGSVQEVVLDLLTQKLSKFFEIKFSVDSKDLFSRLKYLLELVNANNDIKQKCSELTKERLQNSLFQSPFINDYIGILIDVVRDVIDSEKTEKREVVTREPSSETNQKIIETDGSKAVLEKETSQREIENGQVVNSNLAKAPKSTGYSVSNLVAIFRRITQSNTSEPLPKAEQSKDKFIKDHLDKFYEENRQAESFFKELYKGIQIDQEANLVFQLFKSNIIPSMLQYPDFQEEIWDKMLQKIKQTQPSNCLEVQKALISVLEDYAKEIGIKIGQTHENIVDNKIRLGNLAGLIQDEVNQFFADVGEVAEKSDMIRTCGNISDRFSVDQSIGSLFLILNALRTRKNPSGSQD